MSSRHAKTCRCTVCEETAGLRKWLYNHGQGWIHQEDLPDTMESNCLHCQRERIDETRLDHGLTVDAGDRESRITNAKALAVLNNVRRIG